MWIGDFCAPRTARPANPKRRWRDVSILLLAPPVRPLPGFRARPPRKAPNDERLELVSAIKEASQTMQKAMARLDHLETIAGGPPMKPRTPTGAGGQGTFTPFTLTTTRPPISQIRGSLLSFLHTGTKRRGKGLGDEGGA